MAKTIGVIGLGSIGMRHAKNLKALGHSVTGFDPQLIGDGFASIWPVSRLEEFDGVVIASPTKEHLDHIEATIEAKKPVFVEKPIASMMFPLAAEIITSHLVMVGYNLRFHACVKEAKRWIAGEAPVWATFTCAQKNNKPAYLRDGVILNWSHEIDLALYLLGPAKVVGSSTRLTDGHDDITDILLEHNNGCRTTIHLDYVTAPEERHFTIQCKGVRLKADLVNNVLAEIPENGTIDIQNYPNTFDDNYLEEMQAFIDRIDGKETIGCTGEEALKVLEICLKVREQEGLK
tara:strand:- start:6362 stop:7231 length:870 start_codon:yes stop_codon:yes gene_type:complete